MANQILRRKLLGSFPIAKVPPQVFSPLHCSFHRSAYTTERIIGVGQPTPSSHRQVPSRVFSPLHGFFHRSAYTTERIIGVGQPTPSSHPQAKTDRHGLAGEGSFKSMNFVQSILEEDEQFSRKKKRDFVHVLLMKKKTFVAVTDARGNKKTGASAGSLEDRKGRSRLSRYASEATAEHAGRSARKIGLKSVVMKVKGFTFFSKKKKAILSYREGFRGEGVGGKSRILSIYDVTQLPHNGCRLPKKRRV